MRCFVKLYLKRDDVEHILECLYERLHIWEATIEYIETGYCQSADCIEECSDPQEAIANKNYYQYVISNIEKQKETQENDYEEKI
ncbi:MAG: hypothetical protein WHS88_10760 [Anaerohalosphaeraceae bacterium]